MVLNHTSNSIFYSPCTPTWMEVLDGDRVIKTMSVHWIFCAYPAPFRIKPGIQNAFQQIKVPTSVLEALAADTDNEDVFSETYSYQLKLSLYKGEIFGEELPVEMRRTNRFGLSGFEDKNEYQ